MKAVMIIYNQTLTDRVDYLLDELKIRGYSKWEDVHGRGTQTGEPHLGTHTWPEMNSSTLVVVDDEQVELLLEYIKALDIASPEVGVRAFVWTIDQAY